MCKSGAESVNYGHPIQIPFNMAVEHLIEDADPLLGLWLLLCILIRVIREGDPTNLLINLAKVSILKVFLVFFWFVCLFLISALSVPFKFTS